eukprot:scaffold12446_cov27-Tisochrysis_lutea.AAC.2
MDAPPEDGNNMQRAVGPVHAEREQIVVGDEASSAHRQRQGSKRRLIRRLEGGIEARHAKVERHHEAELRDQCEAIMHDKRGELFTVASAKVALGLEGVFLHRLRPPRRTRKEDGFEVRVVKPTEQRARPHEGGQLAEAH